MEDIIGFDTPSRLFSIVSAFCAGNTFGEWTEFTSVDKTWWKITHAFSNLHVLVSTMSLLSK